MRLHSIPNHGVLAALTLAWRLGAWAQVTHHTKPDNLRVTADLGCIGPEAFSSRYTPADLYPAAAACVNLGEDVQGVILYGIAGAYSQYDLRRVRDETAHDAPGLLRSQAFASVAQDRLMTFKTEVQRAMANPKMHQALCQALERVGPPTYAPVYMTQHGMGAFLQPDADAQVDDLDPGTAWAEVLTNYTQCSAP